MYFYCIFCENSKCESIAAIAEEKLSCRAIRPKQIQHQMKGKKERNVVRDFLPGYVFLYGEKELFPDLLCLRWIPGVHQFMGDAESGYLLTGPDEVFSRMILDHDGVIGRMTVYEKDHLFHLDKSELSMYDVVIKKVDHRKHRMQIQFDFASHSTRTWVEYVIKEAHDPSE